MRTGERQPGFASIVTGVLVRDLRLRPDYRCVGPTQPGVGSVIDMSRAFQRYIGIDYSGAETPTSSLKGLRIYEAEVDITPREVQPPEGPRKYWTRKGIAEWLVRQLADGPATLVGIDHGFSFPLPYFERYRLPLDWPLFLEDFQRHWPTDEDHTYVEFVRDGTCGDCAARSGNSRWRRLTELRARSAKSVFQFDVQGSVAKSTHAGLPWLLYIRRHVASRVHFWPFDGWIAPPNSSVIAEVYPSLWSRSFHSAGRSPDQQDAFATAEWFRRTDGNGTLTQFFSPDLDTSDRKVAEIEGWILGVE